MGTRTFSDLITFTRASTGTYFDGAGVMQTAAVDQPRMDYDPATGEKLGLLIEEQRTNLLLDSQNFGNWVASGNVFVDAAAIISPDGTLNGAAITETTTPATHVVTHSFTSVASAMCLSVYVKANGRNYVGLRELNSGQGASFDISTASQVSNSFGWSAPASTFASSFNNGWVRIGIVINFGAASSRTFAIYSLENTTSSSFAGDSAKGFYAFGAQLETGAFPTSYIPTTSAQVTRSADVASITGTNFSDWYRQEEGTIVVSTSSVADTSYATSCVLTDGTSSNNLLIQSNSTSTNQQWYVVNGGAAQVSLSAQAFSMADTTTAAAYKLNDFAYSTQGASVSTDVSATVPTTTQLVLGAERTSNYLNGHIKSIKYYPKRLSNAELQAMTA